MLGTISRPRIHLASISHSSRIHLASTHSSRVSARVPACVPSCEPTCDHLRLVLRPVLQPHPPPLTPIVADGHRRRWYHGRAWHRGRQHNEGGSVGYVLRGRRGGRGRAAGRVRGRFRRRRGRRRRRRGRRRSRCGAAAAPRQSEAHLRRRDRIEIAPRSLRDRPEVAQFDEPAESVKAPRSDLEAISGRSRGDLGATSAESVEAPRGGGG